VGEHLRPQEKKGDPEEVGDQEMCEAKSCRVQQEYGGRAEDKLHAGQNGHADGERLLDPGRR